VQTSLLPRRLLWRVSRWALAACLGWACLNPQPDTDPLVRAAAGSSGNDLGFGPAGSTMSGAGGNGSGTAGSGGSVSMGSGGGAGSGGDAGSGGAAPPDAGDGGVGSDTTADAGAEVP
jgi:hypothetical protein